MSNRTIYRSLVGALQYLTFSRPDIAHSVNVVCQYMTRPPDMHYLLVKRILRNHQGTLECGLTCSPSNDLHISNFSNVDWAANINTRRSIIAYVVYLGRNPTSWQSKKQASVSRRSTEAKYKALAHCTVDVCWIKLVLKDLNKFVATPPVMHCDNISTLALSSNPVFHSRIKHLDTNYHFVKERAQKKDIIVHYVSTESQVADILTKGLHSPAFIRHCSNLKLGYPS